ncbi:hypothetical protein H4Q26_000632 [Puccinia striiformis f. sp. tritici PST-130]|nr:hypothetical protein H4Q26_000632 [Puccinia striiformis f. sp. tritici PST-130]
MIKILRNFHYVDDKGKDQGINVRNREKKLPSCSPDSIEFVKKEGKLKLQNKYIGGMAVVVAVVNSNTSGSSNSKQSDDFEEYDAGEWEDRPAPSASRTSPSTTRASISSNPKEVDLFSMDDDDDFGTPQAAPSTTNAANTQNVAVSLDATSPSVASGVSSTGSKPNVFALLNATSSTPATQMSNTGGSGMFGGNNNMNSMSSQPMPTNTNNMFGGSSMMQPMIMNNNGINNNTQGIRPGGQYNNTTAITSKPPVDSFDDLFSFAGLTTKTSSNANSSNTGNNGQPKLSMAAMARNKVVHLSGALLLLNHNIPEWDSLGQLIIFFLQ